MCWRAVGYLMSYPGATRIMVFLEHNPQFDHSKSQICKNANVTYEYFNRVIPIMIQMGIIKVTRKLLGNTMYKVNSESGIVIAVRELEAEIDFHIKNPCPLPKGDW